MATYFVVTLTEDGDVYMERMDKRELLARLNDEDARYEKVHPLFPDSSDIQDADPGSWIIKGDLVRPVEKKVVKEYGLE
jgi:hypothetical protein